MSHSILRCPPSYIRFTHNRHVQMHEKNIKEGGSDLRDTYILVAIRMAGRKTQRKPLIRCRTSNAEESIFGSCPSCSNIPFLMCQIGCELDIEIRVTQWQMKEPSILCGKHDFILTNCQLLILTLLPFKTNFQLIC